MRRFCSEEVLFQIKFVLWRTTSSLPFDFIIFLTPSAIGSTIQVYQAANDVFASIFQHVWRAKQRSSRSSHSIPYRYPIDHRTCLLFLSQKPTAEHTGSPDLLVDDRLVDAYCIWGQNTFSLVTLFSDARDIQSMRMFSVYLVYITRWQLNRYTKR